MNTDSEDDMKTDSQYPQGYIDPDSQGSQGGMDTDSQGSQGGMDTDSQDRYPYSQGSQGGMDFSQDRYPYSDDDMDFSQGMYPYSQGSQGRYPDSGDDMYFSQGNDDEPAAEGTPLSWKDQVREKLKKGSLRQYSINNGFLAVWQSGQNQQNLLDTLKSNLKLGGDVSLARIIEVFLIPIGPGVYNVVATTPILTDETLRNISYPGFDDDDNPPEILRKFFNSGNTTLKGMLDASRAMFGNTNGQDILNGLNSGGLLLEAINELFGLSDINLEELRKDSYKGIIQISFDLYKGRDATSSGQGLNYHKDSVKMRPTSYVSLMYDNINGDILGPEVIFDEYIEKGTKNLGPSFRTLIPGGGPERRGGTVVFNDQKLHHATSSLFGTLPKFMEMGGFSVKSWHPDAETRQANEARGMYSPKRPLFLRVWIRKFPKSAADVLDILSQSVQLTEGAEHSNPPGWVNMGVLDSNRFKEKFKLNEDGFHISSNEYQLKHGMETYNDVDFIGDIIGGLVQGSKKYKKKSKKKKFKKKKTKNMSIKKKYKNKSKKKKSKKKKSKNKSKKLSRKLN